MAILTKQQLKTLRSNVITTNGVGLITGANLGSFTDDFIDSIWDYVDTSTGSTTADLGNLEVANDTTLRNKDNTGTFIGLTNEVNIGSNNSINISSSNELFVSSTNTAIYSSDTFTFRINTPTPTNKLILTLVDNTFNGNTFVNGEFRADDYRSSDGSYGITQDVIIGSPLLNKTVKIKNGLITEVIGEDGWEVQVDVFNINTSDPVPGLTVDIYPNQSAPPVGDPIASYVTNSSGRVTFTANPNSIFRLHIYGGIYDDIYPLLEVDENPKLQNYDITPTG